MFEGERPNRAPAFCCKTSLPPPFGRRALEGLAGTGNFPSGGI